VTKSPQSLEKERVAGKKIENILINVLTKQDKDDIIKSS
jgi:hypothetical protein